MERSVKSLVKAGPLNPSLLLQFHLWTLKNRPNHGSDSVQSLVFFKMDNPQFSYFYCFGEMKMAADLGPSGYVAASIPPSISRSARPSVSMEKPIA